MKMRSERVMKMKEEFKLLRLQEIIRHNISDIQQLRRIKKGRKIKLWIKIKAISYRGSGIWASIFIDPSKLPC
jgi:hypothetical protein